MATLLISANSNRQIAMPKQAEGTFRVWCAVVASERRLASTPTGYLC
jgi:hypothetical protein